MTPEHDCARCRANDRLVLKLRQEIERLKSRVKTYKKKTESKEPK